MINQIQTVNRPLPLLNKLMKRYRQGIPSRMHLTPRRDAHLAKALQGLGRKNECVRVVQRLKNMKAVRSLECIAGHDISSVDRVGMINSL